MVSDGAVVRAFFFVALEAACRLLGTVADLSGMSKVGMRYGGMCVGWHCACILWDAPSL